MKGKIALVICIVALSLTAMMTMSGCQSIYVIDGIVISSAPSDVHYSLGETLDLDGLEVTVNYANGRSGVVSNNDDLVIKTTSPSGVASSGLVLSEAGANVVEVEYKEYYASFCVAVLPDADYYVDTNNGHDILSGDSAVNAKKSLSAVMNLASDGDVICFVSGEHTMISSLENIVIDKSITLIGAGDNSSKLIMSGSSITVNADDVVIAGLDISFTNDLTSSSDYITVNGDDFTMYSNKLEAVNQSSTASSYNLLSLGDGNATVVLNDFVGTKLDNFIDMADSSEVKSYSITYNTFSGNGTAVCMGLADYNIDNNTFDLTLSSDNAVVDFVVGSDRYIGSNTAYDNTFNSNTVNGANAVLKYSSSIANGYIFGNYIPQINDNKFNDGTRNVVLIVAKNGDVALTAGDTSTYPIDISGNSYDSSAVLLNKVLYQYTLSADSALISVTSLTALESVGINSVPAVIKAVEV